MITIIHGSDTSASRNYFYNEKSKIINSITINGVTITYPELVQILQGNGLFESDQIILVDELFSKRKPSTELNSIVTLISQTTSTIIIWESKDLTPKQLGNFKKADVKQFKLPSVLFSFLDSVYPRNGTKAISLFNSTIQDQPEELVFFMLVRHIRTLLALSPSVIANEVKQSKFNVILNESEESQSRHPEFTSGTISEVSRLAPWQKGKLAKQAILFTPDALLDLYRKLYRLEFGQKTGNLTQPLSSEIDLLLINL